MPRKLTVECTCDRCGRIWYEDYTEGEEPPQTTQLEVKMTSLGVDRKLQSREVKFEVLCGSCADTLGNYVEKLGELKHRSPAKAGGKEEPAEADSPDPPKKATPRKSSAGASSSAS